MTQAPRNSQLVRTHLKSTIPQTQAAEASAVHMQDNYIQSEPPPPPSDEEVEMAGSSNSTQPPPGGSPVVMPVIDLATASRRRVRHKEKENTLAGSAASIKRAEIKKNSKLLK